MAMRRQIVNLVLAACAAGVLWQEWARIGDRMFPGALHGRRETTVAPIPPEERALAVALLLDSPRPPAVIEEGIRMAEQLRRRFEIDTGHRHADRLVAARRARAELDRLVFTRDELRAAARDLGHDLDACGTWCRNVAKRAELELTKRELRRLAAG